MRALLSTYWSRGDVEPMVGLAVLLALGAEVRVPTAVWINPPPVRAASEQEQH